MASRKQNRTETAAIVTETMRRFANCPGDPVRGRQVLEVLEAVTDNANGTDTVLESQADDTDKTSD